MRTAAVALAACSAVALAAAPAAPASSPPPATASVASCAGSGGPLYGIDRIDGTRMLVRIARRTLRPLPGLRLALGRRVYGWNWAFSPDCDAVALAGPRGRILLVDLERGRRIGTVNSAGVSAAGQIAWPRPDRVMAFSGSWMAPRVVSISVPDGRVIASRGLGAQQAYTEATSLGIVALAGPRDRIGPATLTLATPDGGMLRVPLPEIRAGVDEGDPRVALGRQLTPGVAVDEASGRAYVVAANEPLVAEVDLATGVVAYHELRGGERRATAAKGLRYGASRVARWIGPGTIAVAGEVTRTRRNWRRAVRRGLLPATIDPYGLRLIRTGDWSVTTLNPILRWFTWSGDVLLGMDSVPTSLSDSNSTGLVAYEADGRRRFTRFRGGGRGGIWGAAWPYAYVTAPRPRRTYVVDLRTGRRVNLIRGMSPPMLLVR